VENAETSRSVHAVGSFRGVLPNQIQNVRFAMLDIRIGVAIGAILL
jgi:hypothetical protein